MTFLFLFFHHPQKLKSLCHLVSISGSSSKHSFAVFCFGTPLQRVRKRENKRPEKLHTTSFYRPPVKGQQHFHALECRWVKARLRHSLCRGEKRRLKNNWWLWIPVGVLFMGRVPFLVTCSFLFEHPQPGLWSWHFFLARAILSTSFAFWSVPAPAPTKSHCKSEFLVEHSFLRALPLTLVSSTRHTQHQQFSFLSGMCQCRHQRNLKIERQTLDFFASNTPDSEPAISSLYWECQRRPERPFDSLSCTSKEFSNPYSAITQSLPTPPF